MRIRTKRFIGALAALSFTGAIVSSAAPNVGVSGRCYVPDSVYPDEHNNPYTFDCPDGTTCCYGALYGTTGVLIHADVECCPNALCCHSELIQGTHTAYMYTWCEECPSDPGSFDPDEPGDIP